MRQLTITQWANAARGALKANTAIYARWANRSTLVECAHFQGLAALTYDAVRQIESEVAERSHGVDSKRVPPLAIRKFTREIYTHERGWTE